MLLKHPLKIETLHSLKYLENFKISTAPASFEDLLALMQQWRGTNFGLKMFDTSVMHSDPKISKVLYDRVESRLRTVIDSNRITLYISFEAFDITQTAVLNLEYDVAGGQAHCILRGTDHFQHSFDVDIKTTHILQ